MSFRSELEALLNHHSMENGSNTPDFILADYMTSCLRSFDLAVKRRDTWYGVKLYPGCNASQTPEDLDSPGSQGPFT
jgi:hypothetical protein